MSRTHPSILGLVFLLAESWTLVCPPPASALTSESSATSWRWIGLKKSTAIHAPCPVPAPPWITRQLFNGPFVADHLEAFCLYELEAHCLTQGNPLACSCELDGDCIVDPADVQNDLLKVVESQLARIDPDHMALALAATDVQEIIQGSLHDFFLEQAGSQNPSILSPQSPPRLALLDSKASAAANPNDLPSRSPHGESLLAMARDLLCNVDHGFCATDVTTRLALPYVLTAGPNGATLVSRDDVRGGHVGTVGELAEAIYREVQDWLLAAPTVGLPDQPLILNLSLAWSPQETGNLDVTDNGHVAVMAVFQALQDATCKGALAIVAAGNRSDGPDPARSLGPLLPAAWERVAAPDLAACQHLGSSTPDPSVFPTDPGAYRPLVYAVGGITSTGQPLVNARDKSTPPRVAFGGPAIAGRGATPHPVTILTGSSVATLIVSASAAAVWAEHPERPSHAIMDQVDLRGEQPGQQPQAPDLQLLTQDGEQPPSKRSAVLRVSLCSSLELDCPAWRDRHPEFSELQLDKLYEQAKTYTKDTFVFVGAEPACQTGSFYTQGSPVLPCPQLQLTGIQDFPWVFPQPQSIPCPPCQMLGPESSTLRLAASKERYQPAGAVFIELDDSFRGLQLGDATLTLCPRSPSSEVYSLDSWQPAVGDKVVILGLEPPSCRAATLSFSVTDASGRTGSINSPIAIFP